MHTSPTLWRILTYYTARLLVCGINHKGNKHRLLKEKELTYKKVRELALTLEAAAKGSKDISTTATRQPELISNYTKSVNSKQSAGKTTQQWTKQPEGFQTKPCYHCGETHLASQCKFRTVEYHQYHKTGHIAKV